MAEQSFRWRGVGVDTSAPKIKNHTATHVGDGRIFFFGGYDGAKNHRSLHIFHCDSKTWEVNKAATGDLPPGRNGHTATLVDGYIYIIGGWLGRGPLAAGDMYRLHVKSLKWEQLHFKDGASPGPCNMHTADLVPGRRIVVFRGGDGHEYLNDVHIFDIETMVWSHPDVTGVAPTRRANHASAVYGNYLFILGGWDGSRRLNDIHVLHVDTLRWDRLNTVGGSPPSPRAGMSLTANGERLLLFGGSGPHSQCFNDLQVLDVDLRFALDSASTAASAASASEEPVVDELGAGRGRSASYVRRPVVQWLHTTCVEEREEGCSGNPGEAPPGGGGGGGSGGGGGGGGSSGSDADADSGGRTDSRLGSRRAQLKEEERVRELCALGWPSDDGSSVSGVGAGGGASVGGGSSSSSSSARASELGARGVALGSGEGDESGDASPPSPSGGRIRGDMPNPMEEGAKSALRSSEVLIRGTGPDQRAGHTATMVGRRMYVFGGSFASNYLRDMYILDTDPIPVVKVAAPSAMVLLQRNLGSMGAAMSDVSFVLHDESGTERIVRAHRIILACVSAHFRALFTSGFRESTYGVDDLESGDSDGPDDESPPSRVLRVEVPDVPHAVFVAMVEYLYTGCAPALDFAYRAQDFSAANPDDVTLLELNRDRISFVVALMKAADKFMIDHLKQLCERALQHVVNRHNVDILLQLAERTNAPQLRAICTHFARNHRPPHSVHALELTDVGDSPD